MRYMTWWLFPRYWAFVRGIHRLRGESTAKRWITSQRASNMELCYLLPCTPEMSFEQTILSMISDVMTLHRENSQSRYSNLPRAHPPPATRQARFYRANWATQTLLFWCGITVIVSKMSYCLSSVSTLSLCPPQNILPNRQQTRPSCRCQCAYRNHHWNLGCSFHQRPVQEYRWSARCWTTCAGQGRGWCQGYL